MAETDYIPSEAPSSEGSSLFANLPRILWERRWLVIVPLVVISVAATIAAFVLPRTYQSRATLLVESQDLPGTDANASTGAVIDERMAKIRQQILSRPDLVGLIQDNNLYNAASRAEPLSALVDRMRAATSITAVDADIKRSGGRQGSSIAFQLSYNYPEAAEAQLVAQTFVDRLLKLDASEAQSQAQNNVRYLEDQEASLQSQVSRVEGEINRITGQNGAALANAGGMGMISMGGGQYESQIAALQRENAQLTAQTGQGAIDRDPGVIAAQSTLAAVRAQFADTHPDVKLAEIRLAGARSVAAENSGTVSGTVRRQISANNSMIAQLQQARGAEQGRATALAAAQARGPAVAQQVQQLQARADIIRSSLGRVSSNLLNARSMAKLAEEQRGERLTLIEPPVTPDRPTSPNRPLLILAGIVVGAGLGVGLALLVELIMRPIRSVDALTRLTGAPPLAVVPVLSSQRARGTRFSLFRRRAAITP